MMNARSKRYQRSLPSEGVQYTVSLTDYTVYQCKEKVICDRKENVVEALWKYPF